MSAAMQFAALIKYLHRWFHLQLAMRQIRGRRTVKLPFSFRDVAP